MRMGTKSKRKKSVNSKTPTFGGTFLSTVGVNFFSVLGRDSGASWLVVLGRQD